MWSLLITFVLLVSLSNAYQILIIYQIPTGSHYILATSIARNLARNGHEITLITPYPLKEPIQNVKEIVIENLQEMQGTTRFCFNKEHATPFQQASALMDMQLNLSEKLLSSKEIQKLLKTHQKFDAVLLYQYFNDALLPLAHHFKAPVVLFSSMPLFSSESFLLGHPTPPSYVPNILTGYTGRMTFWQRLRNTFYDALIIWYYNWFMLPKHQKLAQKYLSNDLYNILNNASLALINSNPSTNVAIPLLPNVKEIGGFHIEEPKPLPPDLQQFLDNSTNGVILYSMGSVAKSADFPKEKTEAILKSFSKLKENILWKFEGNPDDKLPPNVKIMKWIPQSDVLAHPNVKLFISHGGLLSLMESVHYEVPVLGIPLFVDQKMNLALAETNQWAVRVPYQELNEDSFSKALTEVLNNPKYQLNVQKKSKILKDQIIKPKDSLNYWIEYVIRHGGAPHLRCPSTDLNWYQRNLLDLTAFVLLSMFAIFSLVKMKSKEKVE